MIVEVIVVEEEKIRTQSALALNGGGINLRNAGVEAAVSGANHQRSLISDRIGQADSGRDIVGVERNLPGIRPQRVRLQLFGGKSLQVVSRPQADRQMIAHPDGVL